MDLAPLKYKNYTWPHNPRTYIMDYEKNIATHEYPYSNLNDVEDTGTKPRTVQGEGEFVGEGAYEEFKKLASIFYSKGPGKLIHPIWDIQEAIFKSLRVEQEPTPNYVKYSFTFIEDSKKTIIKEVKTPTKSSSKLSESVKEKAKVSKTYTVKKNDTLGAIAKRNKVKLSDLIKRNPQIKNPNLIYPGQKVKL